MAGLDLPVKLRRGLGNGKVVPSEDLAERLKAFDRDGDGAVTQEELVRFLLKNHVGGPWFCQVLAKTLWKIVEERWGHEVDSISVDGLGRIINFSMSAPPRPEKRYVLEPDVMHGLKPKQSIEEYRAAARGETKEPAKTPSRPQPSAAKPPARGAPPRPAPKRPGPRRPGPKPRR